MAVATGRLDPRLGRPEIVRSILGELVDIGRYVGVTEQRRQVVGDVLHHVTVFRDEARGVLRGQVQYLTDTGTPVYDVVLCRLGERYVSSAT